jgi:hypothetical protein
MGKMVMSLDMRADAAIKEVDKLKRRMQKMQEAPKKAGLELGKLVGTAALVGSAIRAAGEGFKGWISDMDEASRKATELARKMAQLSGGAGFTGESPQMRAFISSRRGYQPISADIEQLSRYTNVNTTSSMQERRTALELSEIASVTGMPASFPSLLGSLNVAGIGGAKAGDIAAYMAQNFGGQAEGYAKTVGRLASAGAPVEQIMPFMAASAMGQYSPESIQALYARYTKDPGQYGDFAQWAMNIEPQTIGGENAVRLMGIRRNLSRAPEFGEGYLQNVAQQFASTEGGRRLLTTGRYRRRAEANQLARDNLQDVADAIAEGELSDPGMQSSRQLDYMTFGAYSAIGSRAMTAAGATEATMQRTGEQFGLEVSGTMAQLEQAMTRTANAIERQNAGPITPTIDAMGRN